MAPMSISEIVAIPHEILQYILTYCGPLDVSSFAQTCRLGRNVVYSGDAYIWRQLLITGWDDPRRSLRYTLSALPEDIDWRRCLQNRVHAERMVTSKSPLELDNLRFVIETFMDVIDATSPIPWAAKYMESSSDGLTWLSLLLHRSSVLYQIVSGDTKLGQMIAQLKVYFSLSDDAFHDDPELHFGPLIGQKRRSQSRHFVYDLRNYTVDRSWGPLLPNGSPNWVHLYYLMNVVWANICDLPGFWSNVRPPIGLEAIRAFSAPAAFNSSDWAGIQGRWKRYVCFMDYRDLFAFNFSNVLRGPRDLAFFNDNPHFREATRLIELQLSLIPREELKHTKPEEIPSSPYEAFPPLFFNGKSRAAHGTDSSIEGVVSMDENGVVRYQFWEKTTMSEAPMQWSSQGIQIGKVGCAAGVVGVWTTRVHDAEDPVGPFWLWKMDDDLPPSELFDYN